MTKWDCIRRISKYGAEHNMDAILKLMEWCDKPNTSQVTPEEAEAFLQLLESGGTPTPGGGRGVSGA